MPVSVSLRRRTAVVLVGVALIGAVIVYTSSSRPAFTSLGRGSPKRKAPRRPRPLHEVIRQPRCPSA